MRRRLALVACALVGATAAVAPTNAADPAPVAGEKDAPQVAVVSTSRKYPDRYKRRTVRFVPDARPSPSRVRWIIGQEAARWGVSAGHLASRVACESGFRWWAKNGQYQGLGQFADSTFWRGVTTMPRAVRVKRSRIVKRHTTKIVRYSDNTVKRQKGYMVKVRRTRILRGRIGGLDRLHGWAQIRIMAQAMAGRSAVNDSEWACR